MDNVFTDIPHQDCPAIMHMLDRVGSKWTVMIVGELAKGPLRFNSLLRQIGNISHRILILNLKNLEKDGLVLRRDFETVPPAVEYELTDLGKTLIGPLEQLMTWVRNNKDLIKESQDKFEDEVKKTKPKI